MSNLADLLNDAFGASHDSIKIFGDLIGTAADLSGAIGFVGLGLQLLNIGQSSMEAIQELISRDFALLGKQLDADQILQRNTTLNGYIAPALTQLELLQAKVNAHPSPSEIVGFIQPCVTALNDLGGAVQPDIVWNVTAGWPAYWTDAGQYSSTCYYAGGSQQGDVGYGPQNPPLNADGLTVFYYTYSLPLYLFAVSIFLSVAGGLDPQFATNYADVIRSSADVLKSKHDQIFQTDSKGTVRGGGLTQLSPLNWATSGLLGASCRGAAVPPTAGIRIAYVPPAPIPVPQTATIEYGAVEKYSGYSSVRDNYQIAFESPRGATDPATFFKFQLRLLKLTKDVYIAVGLRRVWEVINDLKKLVGDQPLPGPNFGDWSLRQVLRLANLPPTNGGNSLRALVAFLMQTQPFDTPYSPGGTRFGSTTFSIRDLLTYFPDPMITLGPSLGYDTGGPNAVALDSNGNVVEVHVVVLIPFPVVIAQLFYRVGRVDFAARTIAWGQSIQYDTGIPNAIALDDNGNAVEVHVGTGRLFCRVGKVDSVNQTVDWGQSVQYDTGGPNAVALDNNGNALEVHVGTGRLFYRVGRVDFAARTIAWGQSIQYDTGGPNAVALDDNGNAVEVHVGTGRLFYRVGRVDFVNQTVDWGQSVQYDTGGPNAVALDNNGNALEVHVNSGRLFYRVRKVDFANRTIAWGAGSEYDTGGPNAVALDDNGNAVEVHVGTGRLFYRVGGVVSS